MAVPDLSIVIPIFNEEGTIREMLRRLDAARRQAGGSWEIIYVNDGSSDGSLNLLNELRPQYTGLRIINLSRNFGHQPAATAGINSARGRAVILMDGDLQDAPEAVPRLVEKWRDGYEVVYAVRAKRKENLVKRALFLTFYRIQSRASQVPVPVDAGNFCLMDRSVVDVLRSMPEHNRYFPGLRAYAGFRQTGIVVERGARYEGKPRVKLRGLVRLAMDGIFAFSAAPLRLVFVSGVALSAISVLIALAGLYVRFVLGQPFLGWHFGLSTVFLFAGVQLISVGIIGEYVGRIYDEVKRRPYYVVREDSGVEQPETNGQ